MGSAIAEVLKEKCLLGEGTGPRDPLSSNTPGVTLPAESLSAPQTAHAGRGLSRPVRLAASVVGAAVLLDSRTGIPSTLDS